MMLLSKKVKLIDIEEKLHANFDNRDYKWTLIIYTKMLHTN